MTERLITRANSQKPLALLSTTLPFPKDVNPDALAAGYDVALDGLSLDALESVVLKIVRGTWPETVRFVPRPPELATMVRDEARRFREASAPMISHRAAPMMSALARAIKETSHLQIIAENVSDEEFRAGVKERRWPVGARRKAILQTVFAADPNEKERAPRSTPSLNHTGEAA